MTDLRVPTTARGLLELGVDEHNGDVTVLTRRFRDQARFVVYREGVLTQNLVTNEVSIDAHGI